MIPNPPIFKANRYFGDESLALRLLKKGKGGLDEKDRQNPKGGETKTK